MLPHQVVAPAAEDPLDRAAPHPVSAVRRTRAPWLELWIAWRYMRARRGSRVLSFISAIAIGGVVVGVSALIVVIAVMDGLQDDLRDKFLIASPDVRVLSLGDSAVMPDWPRVLQTVRRVPGVVSAEPFVESQAGIRAGHQYAEVGVVVGLEPLPRGVPGVTRIRESATAGNFSFRTPAGDRAGVVLSNSVAQRLSVMPGDTVELISLANGQIDPATGLPRPHIEHHVVTGLFTTGMYEFDYHYMFLSLASAQQLFGLSTAVTGIEVRTPTRWEAPAVGQAITRALGHRYRSEDWQDQNRSLFHALSLEKMGMAFILLLIVLVAAFNIISTLTMVVVGKTREIGILRAMGMPARTVRGIFFVQGMVIGLLGTMAGLVIGLAVSVALNRYKIIPLDPSTYFIDHLPATTHPRDVALIVLASLVITALATLYPSRQAARLFPVEAIRQA